MQPKAAKLGGASAIGASSIAFLDEPSDRMAGKLDELTEQEKAQFPNLAF